MAWIFIEVQGRVGPQRCLTASHDTLLVKLAEPFDPSLHQVVVEHVYAQYSSSTDLARAANLRERAGTTL
jgi:hypothetical protein